MTEQSIPSHAIRGEDVVLECDYDLQGDSLYSVKWYRNGQEFYRHIPTDRPQTVVFRQAGLIVDVSIFNFQTIPIFRNRTIVSSIVLDMNSPDASSH